MIPAGSPRRFPVLDVNVDALDVAGAVAWCAHHIAQREPTYVCVANVHLVMEAHRNAVFRDVVARAGLTSADGMPLVWIGRRRYPAMTRVYGPDLTLALCAEAARVGWRVYFHGGASGVAAALAEEMRRRHPGLVVAGADSPPFRPLTGEEDAALVEAINGSEADLVFVGLGCPKQETWMADHRGRLAAPVLLGVGAAFDFHTGRVRQAPRWMMAAGLEWLFRWSQEPRRLARRYLVYNSYFLVQLALQLLHLRRSAPDAHAD